MNRAVVSLLLLFASPVMAAEYGGPDLADYYASLKQPDNPSLSCCGEGDAYQADKTDTDARGNLVAIITDTQPDIKYLPDGRVISRVPVPAGTRIVVPKNKIRKYPIPNPTDHTIIFLSGGVYVLCYEPLPGG